MLSGLPSSTVRILFRRRTPWSAHFCKFPVSGDGHPKSTTISLKMFFKDAGIATPERTENARPGAFPRVVFES